MMGVSFLAIILAAVVGGVLIVLGFGVAALFGPPKTPPSVRPNREANDVPPVADNFVAHEPVSVSRPAPQRSFARTLFGMLAIGACLFGVLFFGMFSVRMSSVKGRTPVNSSHSSVVSSGPTAHRFFDEEHGFDEEPSGIPQTREVEARALSVFEQQKIELQRRYAVAAERASWSRLIVAGFGLVALALAASMFLKSPRPNEPTGRLRSLTPAVISAAVFVGTAFVLHLNTTPPATPPEQVPTFTQFLDDAFLRFGIERSSYEELIQLADEMPSQESESYAMTAGIKTLPIGNLPQHGEQHGDHFINTYSYVSEPDEEVWGPLLENGEQYSQLPRQFSDPPSSRSLFSNTTAERVSYHSGAKLPREDEAVIFGGQRAGTLAAKASGRYASVDEAWANVVNQLMADAQRRQPHFDDSTIRARLVPAMRDAVRRVAVTRRPLEVDGEVLSPIYRVHAAFDIDVWQNAIDGDTISSPQNSQRALMLVSILAAVTIVLGGIASRRVS